MRDTLSLFTRTDLSLTDASAELLKKFGVHYTPLVKDVPFDSYFEHNDFTPQYVNEAKKCIKHIWNIGYVNESTFNKDTSSNSENNNHYDSLSIFACEIKPDVKFSRGLAVDLTRAFNRVSTRNVNFNYDMPVIVILKQGSLLSIATCERSERKDGQGEKVGKVTILRNMNCKNLHAGHRQILERIADDIKGCSSYEELHKKWFKSFSIDILSDRFFNEYKAIYEDIIEYVTGKRMVKKSNKWVERDNHQPCEKIMNEFSSFPDPEKAVRDYVKNLMGRLVFIQFLQKKGWMGVPKDGSWGDGDREFVQHLFANCNDKDHFIDHVLEPLFNDINTERNDDLASEAVGIDIKVPYLNGGLFEPDAADATDFPLPRKYMQLMLDFFASYNFTIDENAPDDVEIGVDPEMLGRIFENLLEDNKDKGAFYTPKEIVDYMCRESLIAYLQTGINNEAQKKTIRNFVTTHEQVEDLPDDTLEKLKEVKICDPAIGSGAFPMGLLKELYQCRAALEGFDKQKAVKIKKQIIQQNIYGVDIEKGAVDIARLRFWLALIVDEESPEALPNLDFKIMQGNSLLEQYEGVDLSGLSNSKQPKKKGKKSQEQQQSLVFDERHALENIQKAMRKYYNTDDHDSKECLRKSINNNVREYIRHLKGCTDEIEEKLKNLPIPNDQFFLWHICFKEVFDQGGFDIVIGNPPYVESRSSNVDNNQKNAIQQQLISRYEKSDAKCFPRGADLLIFFYELSYSIAAPNGIISLITENSWLSTDYGFKFQQFVLRHLNTLGIIDSDYKYFVNADINTVITFFEKKGFRQLQYVPFVHCHGDLSVHPYELLNDVSYDNKTISIKSFSSDDNLLSSHKWGFLFSIDNRLLGLLEEMSKQEDKDFRKRIDIGQGLNLTKDCVIKQNTINTSPFFISNNGPLYRWTDSNYYIDNNNVTKTRNKPILILPRGLGTHFCCMNEINGYSASYVEIYEKSKLSDDDKLRLWLFCNSSLCWLIRELTGRHNLGGGMLKAEATDLKRLPLCFNFNNLDEIRCIYNSSLKERVPTNIDSAISSSIHKKIDEIVFKFFKISEYKFLIDLLLERVHRRSNKSKNKK